MDPDPSFHFPDNSYIAPSPTFSNTEFGSLFPPMAPVPLSPEIGNQPPKLIMCPQYDGAIYVPFELLARYAKESEMDNLIRELQMPKELARMLYTLRRGMDVKKGVDAFDKALAARAFSKDSEEKEGARMEVDEPEMVKRRVGEGVETWGFEPGVAGGEGSVERGKRARE